MTSQPTTGTAGSANWIIKLVLALGCLLLLATSVLVAKEWTFLRKSVEATAVISEMATASMRSNTHPTTDYRAGTGYRVIATFRAPDGHVVTVRSPVVSSFTRLKAGDQVKVNYPPGRPDEAALALFTDRWLLPLILGGIGAVAIAIGGAAMWMLTQAGTRVTTARSGGLGTSTVSVVQIGGDADASTGPWAPAVPESIGPVTTPSRTGRWLVVMAILGLVAMAVFFLMPKLEPSASGAAPSDAGIRAPGYPETLKVEPPTMPSGDATQAPLPSEAPPQSTDANELTAMAAAFLARPERLSAAQAVLRDQAAKLSLGCADLRFVPGELLVMAAPFPQFDASGALRRGLVRQRFVGEGCPGRSPLFNAWTFADGSSGPVRTVAGYLGSTRADLSLMRDATPIVLGIAARLVPACRQLQIMDTRLPQPVPAGSTAPWAEEWLVAGCGRRVALTVRFVPDATRGMTRIEVPQELARSLDPA